MAKKHWIKGAIKHKGGLHRALGVPAGEKIPEAKVEKAAHSDNPHLAKMANLAKTLGGMHHAHGGAVTHLAKAAARYGAKTVRRPA